MSGQPVGLEALQQDFGRDLQDGEVVCVIDTHGIQYAVDPETGNRMPMVDPTTGGPLYAFRQDRVTGEEVVVMERGADGIPRPKLRYSSDGVCQACWVEAHEGWTECVLHGFQPPVRGVVGCAVCASSQKQSALAKGLAAKVDEVRRLDVRDLPGAVVNAGEREPAHGQDVQPQTAAGPAPEPTREDGGRAGVQPDGAVQGRGGRDGVRRLDSILRWAEADGPPEDGSVTC